MIVIIIAVLEKTNVLKKKLEAEISKYPFKDLIKIVSYDENEYSDILLIDENMSLFKSDFSCNLCVLCLPISIEGLKARSVVSCGMLLKDSVTLSSIGEEKAMLCLQRNVDFFGVILQPFEKSIPFDRSLSIYRNVSIAFLLLLLGEYYLKENEKTAAFDESASFA